MKTILLPLILFCISLQLSGQRSELANLIKAHAYPIDISQSAIGGVGGELLMSRADTSELVMFGENHGVQEIAGFANTLYQHLSVSRPRIIVTEIGPISALEVERMVRDGNFEAFMSQGVNLHSVPFFFLKQEVPILKTASSKFADQEQSFLWGLDQEFIASAPIVASFLDKVASTDSEKSAVKKFKRASFFNPFLIGMGDGEAVMELNEAFRNSESELAKDLTKQLILSHKIYSESMGGDAAWSNETRETLMMDNFLSYAETLTDSIPHFFFKFGAFHLNIGNSPTVKKALGMRLKNWAVERGLDAMNIYVDCIRGQTVDPLMGGTTPLESEPIWISSIFSDHVEETPMLFDLRPLRGHPDVKEWPYQLRFMIAGYDYLVLFPEATASEFLDGILVTHAYGLAIILMVFLIITSFIILIIRWRMRRKRS